MFDQRVQCFLFLGLEWQPGDLVLPKLEVLEFWAGRIARNLDTIIADGTCVLVVLFDFSTSDLQALAVIPIIVSA